MPEEYIVFPVRGLSENYAFGLQEPGTTREAENVRAINPVNGRIMGAQRAGITNHSDTQVQGTNKIRDLNVVGYDEGAVVWSTLENQIAFPESFDNAYWTVVNGSVTTNDRNAPDGTLTADLITDADAVNRASIYRDFGVSNDALEDGTTYWASVHTRIGATNTGSPPRAALFLIQNAANRSELYIEGPANPPTIYFRSNSTDALRVATNDDPVQIWSEEGFFRVAVGYDWISNASFGTNLRWQFNPVQTAGTNVGSAWIWGAQFEEGTNAGPYVYREARALASKTIAVNVQSDQFGNVYVLDDKANITKYSADLVKIWTIPLPLIDQSHKVRALHVDRFGCVFAAVSEGGRQSRATLWKYIQLPEAEFELWWSIEVGWYIEEIKGFQNLLYTAQNNEETKRARIVTYDQIFSRNPIVAWTTGDVPVAHPIRGMDLNSTGDVLVACDEPVGLASAEEFRLTAGSRGAARTFYPVALDASLDEVIHPTGDETFNGTTNPFLPNLRVWAHYRASDIVTNDVEGELEEGATVLKLRDLSGNERDLTVSSGDEGPTLTLRGAGGLPSLRFNGSNQSMESAEAGSTARPNRDQQKTVLPGYDGAVWLSCMMVRPEAASNQSCILSQQNTGTNAFEFGFWANRDEGSNISNAAFGQLSVYDDTTNSSDNATGTDAHPASGSFTNSLNNAAIVTYLNNNNEGTPAATPSAFRINGANSEVAYYSAEFRTSNARTYLGKDAAGSYYYKGEFSEMFVLSGADATAWADGQAPTSIDTYPLRDSTPNTNGLGGVTGVGANGMEYAEGLLAYAYGMYTILPGGAAVTNQHRFGLDSNGFAKGPPTILSNYIVANAAVGQSFLKYPFVAKISSENGSFQWLVNENTTNMTGSNAGGVGYGVVVDAEDNVFSIGPNASATNATNSLRKIRDNGDTASVTGSNTWVKAWGGQFSQYKTPRMAVDHSNNLYVPVNNSNLNQGVRIYNGSNGVRDFAFELPGLLETYAVAVDPIVPNYRNDLTKEYAAHVYVASDNGGDEKVEVLHRVPLVKETFKPNPSRKYDLIAISQTIVKDVTSSASYTIPNNGVGVVDRSARYIQSAAFNSRLYIVDGKTVKFYDPIDAEISPLVANVGRLPRRASLVEAWRGRLVLGRTADEPQNWFMSKRDDPMDWEFVPFQPTETQAVAGNDTEAGLFPDILNTLVPWSEDVLIFGGDKSIYQMSGDPAAGGRFDLITDKTGMSFGRPWTKDPNGILYFLGSRGGLYRMTPGSIPERLSVNRIERRLQDLNFANYYARLEYNWRDEGVHILLIPYGAGGTQVENYFYEIKTDSFWADTFGTTTSTGVQPTSVTVLDGDDPTDRILFFGCEDGRIRKWDKDAVDDGGGAIDSFVTIDLPRTPGTETIYKGLTAILGHSQNGCTYGLHVGQNPDNLGVAVHNEKLVPGRNSTKWNRARGSHGWLKLRNAQQGHSWSVEEIIMEADPAGRARQRSD